MAKGENVQAQKVPQTGCEITIVGSEDREIVRRSFVCNKNFPQMDVCRVGYNEFDFFLENEEYRPFDMCKIEI
jgi:hypothetical protein